MWLREYRLALVGDDEPQEIGERGVLLRQVGILLVRDQLDPRAQQVLRGDARIENAQALAAERAQLQQAELLHVPLGDGR